MTSTTHTLSQPKTSWQVTAIVFAMVFPSVGTWLYFVSFSGHSAVGAVYAVSKVVQFGFPLVWVLAVERERLSFQLPSRRGVLFGLVFGLAVLLGMLGMYFAFFSDSGYAEEGRKVLMAKLTGFGITTPLAFLGMAAFYCLFHSFMEEYYWRWFVFGRMRKFTGLWTAVVISSLGFMAHHVIVVAQYMDDYLAVGFLSLAVAVGGAVWAWLYERSGSLYAPWMSHMLVDAGIMLIGYQLAIGG